MFAQYKRIIIHGGVHKTGTSAVQSVLRKNANILSQKSVFYPEFRMKERASRMDGNHSIIFSSYDGKSKWSDHCDTYFDFSPEHETLLLSGESFCRPNIMKVVLDGLHRENSQSEIILLFYFRRYDELFESSYAESVKETREISFDINNWRFRIRDILREAMNFIKKDKIIIRPYDPNQWVERNLIHDFFHAINLDSIFPDIPNKDTKFQKNVGHSRETTFLISLLSTTKAKKNGATVFGKPPKSTPIRSD